VHNLLFSFVLISGHWQCDHWFWFECPNISRLAVKCCVVSVALTGCRLLALACHRLVTWLQLLPSTSSLLAAWWWCGVVDRARLPYLLCYNDWPISVARGSSLNMLFQFVLNVMSDCIFCHVSNGWICSGTMSDEWSKLPATLFSPLLSSDCLVHQSVFYFVTSVMLLKIYQNESSFATIKSVLFY
jgi:hypothetical protein